MSLSHCRDQRTSTAPQHSFGYGGPSGGVKGSWQRFSLQARRLCGAFALLSAVVFSPEAHAQAPAAPSQNTLTVLALGDSLTAGYNLPAADAFPVQLEQALRAKGYAVRVINGGVSGDTTAGGLARLGWMLADRPAVALVELGANDALRGLDPAKAEANLDQILTQLKAQNIAVLLVGMKAPPNLGSDYRTAFDAIYPRLAERHQVPLYPFFLDGVLTNRTLLQGDGMHPTADGVREMVSRILPAVEQVLPSSSAAKGQP